MGGGLDIDLMNFLEFISQEGGASKETLADEFGDMADTLITYCLDIHYIWCNHLGRYTITRRGLNLIDPGNIEPDEEPPIAAGTI